MRSIFKKKTSVELCKEYKLYITTICRLLKRNNIEIREYASFGDSIQSALDNKYNFSKKRDCDFYIYDLENYQNYLKFGIAFDVDEQIDEQYGEELLFQALSSREEAYFREQAMLEETIEESECPVEVWEINWADCTEVRRSNFDEIEEIFEYLISELIDKDV